MKKQHNHISKAFFLAVAALTSAAKAQDDTPNFGPLESNIFTSPDSPVSGPRPISTLPPGVAPPPKFEKCYGVAGKNQNNCAYSSFDGTPSHCAGSAKACDPAAWRWVPAGYCTKIIIGTRKDGKILTGSLYPSYERGVPENCCPFDPQNVPKDDSGF